MALLGVPYKVAYWSKESIGGLENITAKIKRPDGVMIGPILLSEVSDPDFSGLYAGVFSTAETFPEGKYLICIISSDEGEKVFDSVYLEKRVEITSLDIGIDRRQVIEAEFIQCRRVEAEASSEGVFARFEQINKICADVNNEVVEADTDNQDIIGSSK